MNARATEAPYATYPQMHGLRRDEKGTRLASREPPRAGKAMTDRRQNNNHATSQHTLPGHPPHRVSHRLFRLKPQHVAINVAIHSHAPLKPARFAQKGWQPSLQRPRPHPWRHRFDSTHTKFTYGYPPRYNCSSIRSRERESRPRRGQQGAAANEGGKGWAMGPAGNMIQGSAQRFRPRYRYVQAFSLSGRAVTYMCWERLLRAADRRRERRAGKAAAQPPGGVGRVVTFEALAHSGAWGAAAALIGRAASRSCHRVVIMDGRRACPVVKNLKL